MSTTQRSLRHFEAVERRALVAVASYDVTLDLTGDDGTFNSRTRIRFSSGGGTTFVDLKPLRLMSVQLDGSPLSPNLLDDGRLPLSLSAGEHELVVEAVMGLRNDGEGLHQHVDPADGQRYLYQMSFMDAAPSVFACFDQPDLKAPYTLHVRAPSDWVVVGNAPGSQVEPGSGSSRRAPRCPPTLPPSWPARTTSSPASTTGSRWG